MNPIDPENPVTEGKPRGLHVISKMDTVILSWQAYSNKNLEQFDIYRSTSTDNSLNKIGSTSPTHTIFYDNNVYYEIAYTYQVRAVTPSFESRLSDPITITPGPTYLWVVDSSTGDLVKLTHDAQHQIFRCSFSGYADNLVVNPRDHTAWFLDIYSERIYGISGEGALSHRINNEGEVLDFQVFWSDSALWVSVTTNTGCELMKLTYGADVLSKITRFRKVIDLSIDQTTKCCWLIDEGMQNIYKIDPEGNLLLSAELNHTPLYVAAFSGDGSCWTTDSSRVFFINSNRRFAIEEAEGNYDGIEGIDIDQNSGACWVLTHRSVSKIDSSGKLLFTIDGFKYPQSISANAFDGSCVVADPYQDRAVIISADGAQVESIPNIQSPWLVCVEYAIQ
ncbi:hypothetical protein JXJ21_18820 [candidate division KSB1 bacterium]|nr:hypothetical protein [candidate division KSB1 bacterium]